MVNGGHVRRPGGRRVSFPSTPFFHAGGFLVPRYVYRRSVAGLVVRWWVWSVVLVVGLFSVQWLARNVVPWLVIGGAVAGLVYVVARVARWVRAR
jgi:hypothetical protein